MCKEPVLCYIYVIDTYGLMCVFFYKVMPFMYQICVYCIITESILQFVDLGPASIPLPGDDNISAPISPNDGIKMFGVTYEQLYVSCICTCMVYIYVP